MWNRVCGGECVPAAGRKTSISYVDNQALKTFVTPNAYSCFVGLNIDDIMCISE